MIPPCTFCYKTRTMVSWVDADKSYVNQTIEMYKTTGIYSISDKYIRKRIKKYRIFAKFATAVIFFIKTSFTSQKFSLTIYVFPSDLICSTDLLSLNRSKTIEHQLTDVAFIYQEWNEIVIKLKRTCLFSISLYFSIVIAPIVKFEVKDRLLYTLHSFANKTWMWSHLQWIQ